MVLFECALLVHGFWWPVQSVTAAGAGRRGGARQLRLLVPVIFVTKSGFRCGSAINEVC
jgi:hypothetical protein